MIERHILDEIREQWKLYTDDSEVWVFQSSLAIVDQKAEEILGESKKFAVQWSSHGTALEATAALCYDHFLIFIVNGKEGPSGCSKDSLTHFMQALGKHHGIDFFNRMDVLHRGVGGNLIGANLNDLKGMHERNEITIDTMVFNNLVKNKLEFLNKWEVPVKDSWHNQFI